MVSVRSKNLPTSNVTFM